MMVHFDSRIVVKNVQQLENYKAMQDEMVPTRYSYETYPKTFLTNRNQRHADTFKSVMEAMKLGASPLVLNNRQNTIRTMFESLPQDQLDMLCLGIENMKSKIHHNLNQVLKGI